MNNLFKKPLFWTNVAAVTLTGLVIAGVAFGWTNPNVTPAGGGGAITVDASGNVGIGGLPNALAKLRVAGNLLVDSGFGITLGGITRTTWPYGGSGVFCSTATGYLDCYIAGVDKVYTLTATASGGPITPSVTSVSTPGVMPYSNMGCSTSTGYLDCYVNATDKVYTLTAITSGGPTTPSVTSVSTVGVRPLSGSKCTSATYLACYITAPDKVYTLSATSSGGPITPSVTSVSTVGVMVY